MLKMLQLGQCWHCVWACWSEGWLCRHSSSRPTRPANVHVVQHETDTELQAAVQTIFRGLQIKNFRLVLANVGFDWGFNKNNCVDTLLALLPTQLIVIIEGATASSGATTTASAATTAVAAGSATPKPTCNNGCWIF